MFSINRLKTIVSHNTKNSLRSSLRLTSALVLCALAGIAQAAPFTYVLNRYDNNVSVVDLASNSIVSSMPAGMITPTEIAIDSDGSRAYLSSTWSTVVSVLDLKKGSLLHTISLGNSGADVALSASGDTAYAGMTSSSGPAIAVIDTATNQITRTIAISAINSSAIALHPDGSRLYSLEMRDTPNTGTVAVIDLASHTVVDCLAVGIESTDIKVSPAGTFAYVVNRDSMQANGSITVIDTRTNTVDATIPVGLRPSGLSFNPTGSQAYVTNSGDNTVSVIDTTSHAVVGLITAGNGPKHVAFNPSGSRAYVTNQLGNTMSIIDTATQRVTASVPVGRDPWGIAFVGEATGPIVNITMAPAINSPNQAQYGIAGTCTPGAVDVRIELTDGSLSIGPLTSTCSPTGQWTLSNLWPMALSPSPPSKPTVRALPALRRPPLPSILLTAPTTVATSREMYKRYPLAAFGQVCS
ncbi:YVTN family beta-propeller protein [Comamonas sp. JUb58]|nr:YVTN family beta-propeller protein [Comamonas sp. JUb58]